MSTPNPTGPLGPPGGPPPPAPLPPAHILPTQQPPPPGMATPQISSPVPSNGHWVGEEELSTRRMASGGIPGPPMNQPPPPPPPTGSSLTPVLPQQHAPIQNQMGSMGQPIPPPPQQQQQPMQQSSPAIHHMGGPPQSQPLPQGMQQGGGGPPPQNMGQPMHSLQQPPTQQQNMQPMGQPMNMNMSQAPQQLGPPQQMQPGPQPYPPNMNQQGGMMGQGPPMGMSQGGMGPRDYGGHPMGMMGPPGPQDMHYAMMQQQYGGPMPSGPPGSMVGMAGGLAAMAGGPYSRLKVEDALSYLDRVKMQFGDQPQVYNQFLDIMKEFKSQGIDTPGVIKRVSTLFEGNPELIRGFNTFLPLGCKIEIGLNGQAMMVPAYPSHPTMQGPPPGQIHPGGPHQGMAMPPSGMLGPPPPHMQQGPPPQQQQQMMQMGPQGSGPMGPQGNYVPVSAGMAGGMKVGMHQMMMGMSQGGPYSQQPPGGMGPTHLLQLSQPQVMGGPRPPGKPQVEFNHAINYVNKIKTRFSAQPEVYKSFLEILHTYQKEQRTIKEVYTQVAQLFRTQNDLLDEFSQFLPEAVPHAEEARQAALLMQMQQAGMGLQMGTIQPPMQGADGIQPPMGAPAVEGGTPLPLSDGLPNKQEGGYEPQEAKYTPQEYKPQQQMDVPAPHPSESLVPSNHHLREPSPPPGMRHSPAVIEHMGTPKNEQWEGEVQREEWERNNDEERAHLVPEDRTPQPGSRDRTPQDVNGEKVKVRSAHKRTGPAESSPVAPPTKKAKLNGRERQLEERIAGSYEEYVFFDKVKHALKNRNSYENFLRLLHLYATEVFHKSELVSAVNPFLGNHTELFTWFKEFLDYRDEDNESQSVGDAPKGHGERVWDASYQEVDYSTFKRYGYSYRILPKNHSQPRCTGRTAFHQEFLNDYWLSFPTSSEDSYFVTSKKNTYEEQLYRCEDERYELDMVIETNLATIKVLEPVAKRLQSLPSEEAAKVKLDDRLGGTSRVIYRKAIERLYGSDRVDEVMEGLMKSPATALPLVLRRLKAKDEEWRRAQREWNKIWRDANEKNLPKSLDHQAITFKQNDRKTMAPKALVQEIETKLAEEADDETGPHYAFTYSDSEVFRDVAALLLHYLYRTQNNIADGDKERISSTLRQFVMAIFGNPPMDPTEADLDTPTSPSQLTHLTATEPRENETLSSDPEQPAEPPSKQEVKREREDEWAHREGLEPIRVAVAGGQRAPANTCLFYANNHWYSFFRLHRTLYERIQRMKDLAAELPRLNGSAERRQKEVAVQLKMKTPCTIPEEHYYGTFLKYVQTLLDGDVDSVQFEELARELYGIHTYPTFTIDKLIQTVTRQVQILVTDECSQRLRGLHGYESARKRCTGQWAESAYRANAEGLIGEDNCYRTEFDHTTKVLTVRLLEPTENLGPQHPGLAEESWSAFLDNYVSNPEPDQEVAEQLKRNRIFLPRNTAGKDLASVLEGTATYNHLEIKHCAYSMRPFFAEGSADFFFRPNVQPPKASSAATERFSAWRAAWLQAHPAEQVTVMTEPLAPSSEQQQQEAETQQEA